MHVPRSTRRIRGAAAGVAVCGTIALLTGCAVEAEPISTVHVTAAPTSAAPRTDPIEHTPQGDPSETGAGTSIVSLAEADTAGTHEATSWNPGDALPSYLQQGLRRDGIADPASLSRIAATHGVEAWIGTGTGQFSGQVCIVSAQSQLPESDAFCVEAAEFDRNGAGFFLRLPNGSQAIEAYALPERAKGTGIAPGAWEAPNDRILLRAKPSVLDEPPLSVPTVDGSAPIVVTRMG